MEAELVISETSYEDQGEYVCEAVNTIGGERRVARSEAVQVTNKGLIVQMSVTLCVTDVTPSNEWEI